MILGIGTDLVYKEKVKNIYSKYKEKFVKKILSTEEQENFSSLSERKKINFLCSSFAAKEALVKALGTGFRGIYPPDITLQKDDLGKPRLISDSLKDLDCHLSITNTDSYTLSFIVLEK
tara:strand:- start:1288 stop:1644 length:357 start_codon:yes stop_codon:yes gene_type:complete